MRQQIDRIVGFYGVVGDVGAPVPTHANVVQLRLKAVGGTGVETASTRVLYAEAQRLRAVLTDALFVVNDRLDVALAVGADGVHLGQGDLPVAAARRVAGDRLLIGVSTHDVSQVRAAVAGGADYLGYGPVFATTTKEHPDPVQGLDALAAAVAAAGDVPVVAIGGITPARAASVAATGAAAACVIGAVNGAADPVAAARAIAGAFTRRAR